MKKFLIACTVIAIFAMAGCTDATMASLDSYGSRFNVDCYSGGKVIYHAVSSGRVNTLTQSDGWEFKDAADGKFVRISGTCVVKQM